MKITVFALFTICFIYTAVVFAQSSDNIDQSDSQITYEKGVEAHQKGDFKTAFSIYSKLAEQGDVYAQYCLSYMYTYGEGVTQDFIEAYIWSAMAAAMTRNEELHKLAVGIHKNAAKNMTAAQITKAQTTAYERYKRIESQSSQ